MSLRPIEYDCDGAVTIRVCREAKFGWRVAPAFWYLRRPMYTMDAPEIGWDRYRIQGMKARGFDVAYWTGEEWDFCKPKQFATPEDAHAEYMAKVAPLAKRVLASLVATTSTVEGKNV